MWFISLRDLQFRQRRFLIAILSTGVVFGLGLLCTGIAEAFRAEVRTIVAEFGVDAWVVREGVTGPFTASGVLPANTAAKLEARRGVERADPVLILRSPIVYDGEPIDVNVIGHVRGGLGTPELSEGREPTSALEVVIDASSNVPLGTEVTIGPATLTIVGRTEGLSYFAGRPVAFVDLAALQQAAFDGRKVATAIAMRGLPKRLPAGTIALTNGQTRADLLRPLEDAIRSVDVLRYLMWMVAAGIIGALVYLSALERVRDFAVLRAVGSSPGRLFGGLVFSFCRRIAGVRDPVDRDGVRVAAAVPPPRRDPADGIRPAAGRLDRRRPAGEPDRLPAHDQRRPGARVRRVMTCRS